VKKYYKATLCLSSFRQFLYWHKWNGGGGWSEMSFCKGWFDGTALCYRNEVRKAMCCMGWEHPAQKV
jgi:hypothetical protein